MKKLTSNLSLFFILFIGFPTFLISQCTINDATDCQCLDANETDCDLLPDITLSWYGIKYVSDGPTEYPQTGAGSNNGRLRISVSTPNDGVGPLTVRGVDDNGNSWYVCGNDTVVSDEPVNLESFACDNGEEAKLITWQRIYHRNSDGTMGYYDRMAGTMTYHPTHNHNHSDDWGVFTLRTMDENEPNPLNWPVVSDGAKMGFCLMDYGTCGTGTNSTYYGHCRDENRYSDDYLEVFPEFNDGTNGGTIKYNSDFPNFGLGGGNYGCSQVEQGISSGYLDLYGEWLDDQWINLEPGLCNGVYWIVGEVDRNNNYLESNEENNWTTVPVILTQQLDGGGYDIQILSPDEVNLCDGEITTLTAGSIAAEEYFWSPNGETSSSIEVSESGEYSLTTSGTCGEGESQIVTVVVNDPVETPITNNVTVEIGENAILNATATGNIIWQNENGDVVGEGSDFISDPIYENTTFYAINENILIEASETLSTGAFEHEGSGSNANYSGGQYNGGLLFDCFETFTLNSVKVYTDYPGERTIELRNNNGDLINDLLIDIPETDNNGYIVDLGWSIGPGDQYLLTTNTEMNNDNFGDNNPMLKRTTDDLPEFPYIIENVLEITEGYYNSGNNPGSSESYYYYFYDWQVNNDWGIGGSSCFSDPIQVDVFVNQSGCMDVDACNYNAQAMEDDGSCDYSCIGCMDSDACDYDPNATIGSDCFDYPPTNYDCDGNCLVDIDCEGVCGGNAAIDAIGECGGSCEADEDGDGICDNVDECVGEYDECGECNGTGPGEYYDCDGNCINDSDNDGICDDLDECIGEYDECGECNGTGPVEYYDCDGNCINDGDADMACDELDNCPETYNPNQSDFDNDGIGDACDGLSIDQNNESFFSLFPNPTNGNLNIVFNEKSENARITLFDHLGELVKEIYTGNINSDEKMNIDVSNLSSGIYFIQYIDSNNTLKKSFTVTK